MSEKKWKNRIVEQGERPAGEFLANPGNWRIHPKNQRDALRGVLGEVGWVTGVIVNRTTGHMLDGHARVEEALKLGDDTPVPFIEVELTEAEEKTVLATFDPISAMAAADKEQLDALLHDVSTASEGVQSMLTELAEKNGLEYGATIGGTLEDAEPQIDKAAELAKKWGTARGQVWRLGEHRLMCGDSTSAEDVARLMAGERARITFTSPPYNGATHLDYGGGRNFTLYRENKNDDMTDDEYLSLINGFMGNACAAVEDGFVFVNLGYNANSRGLWVRAINPWSGLLWETVIWKKTGMPVPHGLTRSAEFIFVFGVGSHGHLNAKNVTEFNVWDIPNTGSQDKETHRACFPVGLPKKAINLSTSASEIVYEPFSGSGTTIIACEQLGRKCRAMEIAPEYVAVALERWATATGKTPERVDGVDT